MQTYHQRLFEIVEDSNASDDHFEDEKDDSSLLTIGRKLNFSRSERRVRDLYNDKQEGILDPSPSFQRQYVWDDKKASLLIESMLLNVPIPVIFTSEENGVESVIDGQQRVTSAFRFLGNEFPIKGIKIFKDLDGTYYRDLSKEYQVKIRNYSLSIVKISEDSDEEVKFEIFERINSGSVNLNEQEIRNCIYRGKYNEFLKSCATEGLLQLLMFESKRCKRMEDVQMVLRFLAFYQEGYANYPGRLVTFLNNHMKNYRKIHEFLDTEESEKKLADLRKTYRKSLELSKTVFGDFAFKACSLKTNGQLAWGKINRSLFDVIMWGFTLFDKPQVIAYSDSIREALINLILTDSKFLPKDGTLQKENVRYRFNRWHTELESIITTSKQLRCFSYALKQQLFSNNPTCSLCGQRINSLDDSEVHHHVPYWKGGETIPENAKLVHRYCNRRQGGRE